MWTPNQASFLQISSYTSKHWSLLSSCTVSCSIYPGNLNSDTWLHKVFARHTVPLNNGSMLAGDGIPQESLQTTPYRSDFDEFIKQI